MDLLGRVQYLSQLYHSTNVTIDGVGIREAVIMTRHLYPVNILGRIQDFWKAVHIYKGVCGGLGLLILSHFS